MPASSSPERGAQRPREPPEGRGGERAAARGAQDAEERGDDDGGHGPQQEGRAAPGPVVDPGHARRQVRPERRAVEGHVVVEGGAEDQPDDRAEDPQEGRGEGPEHGEGGEDDGHDERAGRGDDVAGVAPPVPQAPLGDGPAHPVRETP